jgi:glycosyltransferase involved in cell wall biosynthesis
MPFFSVVIPLYNKENHIAGTLKSALAQTFTDFEVIIINDGSTDGSETAVKTFDDPRIVYQKFENGGVSASRNKGIALAKGEVIAFLDADDCWKPNHLEGIYTIYNENPSVGMVTSKYTIKTGKMIEKPVLNGISDGYKGIVKDFFYSSLINRVAVTSGVTIPKKVFTTIGLFDSRLSNLEDTEMWIKIALRFPVGISENYSMVYTFDAPQSLSKKKMADRYPFDFSQFENEEKHNKSLKAFLDVYRIEYALKYRVEGDIKNSKKLYRASNPENLNYKTRILFNTPPFLLRLLLKTKHWLHKKGITFTVYN